MRPAFEFSRPVRLDEIGASPHSHAIAAEADELARLAERFALAALHELHAEIALSREAAGIRARGRVTARVDQSCVVSGEAVPARIDEAVDVLFTRSAASDEPDEEMELSASDCDMIPLEGEAVDIGELAAETMSLALAPYPRLSDEALAEHRRLLTSEEDAATQADDKKASNPFSVLKKKG